MQVDFTDDEITLLREVLDDIVRDLSPEIADTDNPGFRRNLRGRREQLRAIADKLGDPARTA